MAEPVDSLDTGLIAALRRRKVVQWAVAYAAGAWLVLQVTGFLADAFHWPDVTKRVATLVLLSGLPLAIVRAWFHGARGQQRTGVAEVAILAAVLAVAGGTIWWYLGTASRGSPPAPPTASAPPHATQPRPAPSGKSIAVLPFVALSQGEDDVYFADGLTEEILNALTQVPELLVTARTSAFHFRNANLPVTEVARQLGVANVLEGSVRRSGDRVRITAQLIRANDGFHLWSQDYDREAADAIDIQEDIAQRVAAALDVLLDQSSRAAMQRALSRNVDAFVAYQKGRHLYEEAHMQVTNVSFLPKLREANAAFDAALAIEPDLFAARLLSSDLYTHQLVDPLIWGHPEKPSARTAREAAARLSEILDRALTRARTEDERNSAAVTRIYLSDVWSDFAAASARQLAGRSCVETEFNDTAMALGLASAAQEFYRRAIACDPLFSDYYRNLASATLWSGDAAGALQVIDESRRRQAADPRSDWIELVAAMSLGEIDRAKALAATRPADARITRADFELVMAAAQGDAALARESWKARPADARGARTTMIGLAWMGDREAANSLARRLDAEPLGQVVLSDIALHCYCGAPFDIDQTPRFAARVAESGFAWPPRKPVRTPLKDW